MSIFIIKSFNINTDKFNVDCSSGNVNIAGTLDVLNNSHFYESMLINKNLLVSKEINTNDNTSSNFQSITTITSREIQTNTPQT